MQGRCARQGTSAAIFKSTVRHQCTSVRTFGPSSLHKPFGLLVSIRGGRESASNAACSRQLVFPNRDAPLRHAPIHPHPYMERDPKRAVLGPCLHLQREPPQLDANDDNKAARETRLDGEAPPPWVISSPKRSRLAPCPILNPANNVRDLVQISHYQT